MSGRAAPAAGRLLEVAGPDLYRRNAFRVTGLPTDAPGRTVRERRQKATAALAVGASSELPLPAPATSEEIRAAFDDLGDAQRRIVDELFWLWSTPNATCSCVSSLHGDHDAAVRAHARALDAELAGDPGTGVLWADAAQRWTALLRRAAFWDHVRHRIHALDDRRLDESTLDALRDTLPRALVKPVVDLAAAADEPARLAAQAAQWFDGHSVADDLLAEASATLAGRISTMTRQAADQLYAGRPHDAAATLESAIPALHRLEGLAPHDRHRRTAGARNGAAVLLNNCALALINGSGPTPTAEAGRLLDSAHELATEAQTRRTIEANRAAADDRTPASYGRVAPPGGSLDMARNVGEVLKVGIFFASIAWGIHAIFGVVAGVIAAVLVALFMWLAISSTVEQVRARRGGPR
ncbi:MAG TPA: hypothetical protein VIY28_19830 [Pseudonocardiaceae bacterium]